MKKLLIILLISIVISLPILLEKEEKIDNFNIIHLTFDDIITENILFTDIKIFKEDDEFYLTANAINLTSNTLSLSLINITAEDIVLKSYIGDTIKPEEEKSIVIKTNEDLKDVSNISINLKTQVIS